MAYISLEVIVKVFEQLIVKVFEQCYVSVEIDWREDEGRSLEC
jgi:hypothetical protein